MNDRWLGTRGGVRCRVGRAGSVLLAVLAAGLLAGCSQKEPPLTEEQRQLNVESFEYAWTTIQDRHWDPDLGGLDWQAVHDELRPRVEHAETMSDARAVMKDMIGRLGQSHFGIIPAEVYELQNRPAGEGGQPGTTGLDVRVIDGKALVTRVDAGSPADALGVRPGWQIVRIGDEDLAPIIEKVGRAYKGKLERDYRLAKAVSNRLVEPVGEKVPVRFLDSHDELVNLEIETAEPKGRKTQLGHLPAQHAWIEWRRLDGNIGYVSFNLFMDPVRVMKGFADAVSSFMDADGVVIDLRGNVGGIGAMSMGMSGWFVSDETKCLGTMQTRQSNLKFVVSPRVDVYEGPVAILVDGLTGSTAEIFTGGMKDIGRARVFGTTTAGAALPSMIDKLPNGDGFQYAIANYISAGGEVLEGYGVVPDEQVRLARESLLAGEDPPLKAAVRWIKEQPWAPRSGSRARGEFVSEF